ncbi:hypothetical protein GCM10010339_85520 [Streptomyces alanosinicus]|uniref:Uncharacterized protein n=1 Tax=Streptomyces alanosinicus TaxID=68171 RepID=A0A918YSH7_9ACTN|nr:hypothetical protein GCM10010339_85520 [Streptomyces alanosinicus]
MSVTHILAALGGISVILTAASRLPKAAAGVLRACVGFVHAVHELRAAWRQTDSETGLTNQQSPAPPDGP